MEPKPLAVSESEGVRVGSREGPRGRDLCKGTDFVPTEGLISDRDKGDMRVRTKNPRVIGLLDHRGEQEPRVPKVRYGRWPVPKTVGGVDVQGCKSPLPPLRSHSQGRSGSSRWNLSLSLGPSPTWSSVRSLCGSLPVQGRCVRGLVSWLPGGPMESL